MTLYRRSTQNVSNCGLPMLNRAKKQDTYFHPPISTNRCSKAYSTRGKGPLIVIIQILVIVMQYTITLTVAIVTFVVVMHMILIIVVCLLLYNLAKSKVMSGQVPTCISAGSWRRYSAATLGGQAPSIMIWYPIQSHYHVKMGINLSQCGIMSTL